VQQVESSASRIRQQGSARDNEGAQGPEASVHAGGATRQPANQGRTPVRERILDTRRQAQDGDARNVINACQMGNTETRAVVGHHPRRGGRYDSREDCSPTPEPPGTRVFSREIRTMSFQRRRARMPAVLSGGGARSCQPSSSVAARGCPLSAPVKAVRGCRSSPPMAGADAVLSTQAVARGQPPPRALPSSIRCTSRPAAVPSSIPKLALAPLGMRLRCGRPAAARHLHLPQRACAEGRCCGLRDGRKRVGRRRRRA
jgi:hypothetical protein